MSVYLKTKTVAGRTGKVKDLSGELGPAFYVFFFAESTGNALFFRGPYKNERIAKSICSRTLNYLATKIGRLR